MTNNSYYESISEKILYSEADIQNRIKQLGEQITNEYKGKQITFISILNGAFMFSSDILKHIKLDCEIDFMQVSTYGSGTVSSGNFVVKKDLSVDIENKDVIILEDILDTGYTMENLINYLKEKNPRSIKCCTLFDKPARRVNNVKADYAGFVEKNDYFIVGYGLDYSQKYRNLPFVCILKKEIYS